MIQLLMTVWCMHSVDVILIVDVVNKRQKRYVRVCYFILQTFRKCISIADLYNHTLI